MAAKAKQSEQLLAISDALAARLDALRFPPPVAAVYNPLRYAREPFARYLELYGDGPKEALFLGMNPGPFGMAQTGVPFGEVAIARDWLGVEAPVGRPPHEHPARPVEGFRCSRSEVSGARLWGWVRHRWETPSAFFERFLVLNYCPLLFLESSGRNLTPDKLPRSERAAVQEACDAALAATLVLLRPKWVLGVGKFAEERARLACAGLTVQPSVGSILHPSPASPAANRSWVPEVERQLTDLGIQLPG
jgi:single-strand selective monofunctional uracil DNA glycosylase